MNMEVVKCRRVLRPDIGGSPYVSGEQLLEALRALIKQEAFQGCVVYKKLVKDLEDGQYWSLGLQAASRRNPCDILLYDGNDVDLEKSEFKLTGERNSWNISIGNAVLDTIKVGQAIPGALKMYRSDEEIIAWVTEVRDRLGEILRRG